MKIHLNKILPTPLASIEHHPSSIWNSDVSLDFGKKVMLNASSGKGKSTFTSIMLGLRKDFTGALHFDDRNTSSFGIEEWTAIRKTEISVVFQDLQLFPNLTVKDNLLLKNNLTDTYSEKNLIDFLTILEIDNKFNQVCGILSMGQQQRVAIIRALCQPFKWLILDEPFSHLDKANSTKCLKMINQRCDELNAGFVLTSLGDYYDFEYDQELKL